MPKAQAKAKKSKEDESLENNVLAFNPEAEEEDEGEKKPKKRKKGLLLLAVLVVLIALVGTFLYLTLVRDWGGVRSLVIHTVNKLDPQYVVYTEKIQALEESLANLELREEALEVEQGKLQTQTEDLAKREAELKAQQDALVPFYRRDLDDEKIAELKSLGKIYNNIDAETAAGIFVNLYDVSDMAAILYYMETAKAADVLAHMDEDLAAEITEEMLRN